MRKKLICANWKMHHTLIEGINFFDKYDWTSLDRENVDIVVFPSFPIIYPLTFHASKCGFELGAQNLNENPKGAYTGDVSAPIITSVGVTWVIVGHSERRDIFGEYDELIAKKLKMAVISGLNAVLCVGEHLESRDAGTEMEYVKDQLEIDLGEITSDEMRRVSIAYEPVWAIGTGRAANPDDAEKMMSFIRGWLVMRFNEKIANAARILYGGSVKPENMADYAAMPNVDGALVGGASLDPKSFAGIINSAV